MPVDEERMMAWLDGELTGEDEAAVAAIVAADAELTALADAHRASAARLRAGFDPLLDAPVPQRIAGQLTTAASDAPSTVTDLLAMRAARAAPARRSFLPQWAAIAATLAIGVIAGRSSTGFGPQPLLVQSDAGLEASGPLATALDAQLASAPPAGAVRIMVTFRAQDGRICRTWSTAGQDGIACRTASVWRIAALFSGSSQREGEYRMAGGSNPQMLSTLENMIDGAPFDQAQEQAAKRAAWR